MTDTDNFPEDMMNTYPCRPYRPARFPPGALRTFLLCTVATIVCTMIGTIAGQIVYDTWLAPSVVAPQDE